MATVNDDSETSWNLTQPDADPADEPGVEERELEAYGQFLDSSIRLPGGFRIGWDGIIGLVPGIGDAVGLGLSSWLVWRARRLGLPGTVIARMLLNVGIEAIIGVVPVIGDLFDLVFKANNRNVALMQRSLREQRLGKSRDKDEVSVG